MRSFDDAPGGCRPRTFADRPAGRSSPRRPLAIRAGALWVAANLDSTLPTERGLVPATARWSRRCGRRPAREPLVAGKPAAPLMEDALLRSGSCAPARRRATGSTPTSKAPTMSVSTRCWCSPASAPPSTCCVPPRSNGPPIWRPDWTRSTAPPRNRTSARQPGGAPFDGSDLVLERDRRFRRSRWIRPLCCGPWPLLPGIPRLRANHADDAPR